MVEVSSRNCGRPSKKMWIDKHNFTILKSVDYSASGDERGSTLIKQIHFNAKIRPDTFSISSDRSVKIVMVCSSGTSMAIFKDLGFSVRLPKYLPAGYKLEGYHLFNSQCKCNHRSAQLTYTDGLNVISVFKIPRMISCTDCMLGDGGNSDCTDSTCGIAMTSHSTRRDKSVIVVGDVLPKDVKKITESVE